MITWYANKTIMQMEFADLESASLIDYCIKNKESFQQSLIYDGLNHAQTNESRTSQYISITANSQHCKEAMEIDRKLFNIFSSGLNKYREEHFDCIVNKDEPYDLVRYLEGQEFKTHCDVISDGKTAQRILSGVFYINDDYEGGAISFPKWDLRIKPRANSLLLFPSNFVFIHHAEPVLKGEKYCAITWYFNG